MTREEILEYFKDINYAYNDCTRYDTLKRMIDELQEPCTDAISRQAAIDACLNGWNKDYKEIVEDIRALPLVTPAEKVGHWKYIQYDKPPIGNWHCSECGRIVFLLNSQKFGEIPLYDYCPWCGCKMQEVEE